MPAPPTSRPGRHWGSPLGTAVPLRLLALGVRPCPLAPRSGPSSRSAGGLCPGTRVAETWAEAESPRGLLCEAAWGSEEAVARL